MLEFLWACMVLSVKAAIGGFLWGLILIILIVVFGAIGMGGGAFMMWVRKPKFTKKGDE